MRNNQTASASRSADVSEGSSTYCWSDPSSSAAQEGSSMVPLILSRLDKVRWGNAGSAGVVDAVGVWTLASLSASCCNNCWSF